MNGEIRTLTVIGKRPTTVLSDAGQRHSLPPDWTIYNAPRPIYGTIAWRGTYLTGIFYVAIDPGDRYRAVFEKDNKALDAVALNYVPEEEAYRLGRQLYIDKYGDKPKILQFVDELENRELVILRYLESANKEQS